MTNKINGIDVSEPVLTAGNNDVYYSQKAVDELLNKIKHLQEENEGLKSLNDFNVQKIEVLQEENEKLKEFKKEISKTIVLPDIEEEATNKYKQALEEIKNIAELDVCYNAKLDKYTFDTYAQRILDKINEVLNDRD